MKQLLTMFMVLAVTAAIAQRPEPTAQTMLDEHQFRTHGLNIAKGDLDLDTLLPGNWANRTGVAGYWWGEPMGYFFGTNLYYDRGYGQRFIVTAPYEIHGALYWFAAADGATGDVKFTIWDFADGEPGDVIATSVVPLADIHASTTFLPDEDAGTLGAFYVDFTDDDGNPVEVTSDYVIGADLTDLNDYVPGTYRLGNYSSLIGDGVDLSWIWEADRWTPTTTYGYDMDVAIFPVIFMEFDVTFNVDMTGAIYGDNNAFNPNQHKVFITGSHVDWAEPGSVEEYELELLLPNENQIFFEEAFGGGAIPAGWQNIDANGDGFSWKIVTTPSYTPYTGNYAVMSQSWTQELGDIEPDNWLITPQIQVGSNDYEVSFQAKAQDPNYPAEKISVLVSTTDTNTESFTEIASQTLSSANWVNISASLADYDGEHIYIAFRHWDCEGQHSIVLDDIKISGTPPLIYTISFPNEEIHLGQQEYKYFVVEDNPTWEFGEWEGDPNRGILIYGEMTMHDVWGDAVTYDVTFDVVDEAGEAITDATIVFAGTTNDAGDYDFEAIWGEFDYVVAADGYQTKTGSALIEGDHTEEVMLKLYRDITFTVRDKNNEIIPGLNVLLYHDASVYLGAGGELIFSEDFSSWPPAGWTISQLGSAATGWEDGGGFALHDDHFGDHNSWLITEQITLEAGSPYILSFHQSNHWMAWYGYSGVFVSTGSGAAGHADFVEVYEANTAYAAWTATSIDLSAYAGEDIYIAFVYQGDFNHIWRVDNINIRRPKMDHTFSNFVAGTYDFLITDFNTGLQHSYENKYGQITVEPDVENTQHDYEKALKDGYHVQFNVDMNGATFFDHHGNEINFNHDHHEVYVSTSIKSWAAPFAWPNYVTQGQMAEWPMPGSTNAQRLGYRLSNVGGNIYQSDLINVSADGDFEYKFFAVRDGVATWEYPEYDEEGNNRKFSIDGDHVVLNDIWGEQPHHVTFNVDMSGADGFDHDTDKVYITGSLAGWQEPGDDPDNQLLTRVDETNIYTITLALPAETYEYKYFINEGWGGGEWDGDPNREVTVDDDMVVNDYFGDIEYSVGDDIQLIASIYPNPANDRLNVVNSENIINSLQVFDVTGRVMHDVTVDDNRAVIDVSKLNTGVYILRIHTEKGLEHHKFQVTR